ncbi:MAG: metallophosphoesterase [Lachnospiraceae bacterium]|nr:metallophosphoesterase [Lachnospiraceae bacterium]
MKKILIVSDTHGRNRSYLELVERLKPLDLVIHCGDVEGSEYLIGEAAECPAAIVSGNNDFFAQLPRELVVPIGPYKAWVTHGHMYGVTMDDRNLSREAAARGMDIVIYGHTHRPVVKKENDILVINPGSLTYPRQRERKPSYILMELDDNQELQCRIHYL